MLYGYERNGQTFHAVQIEARMENDNWLPMERWLEACAGINGRDFDSFVADGRARDHPTSPTFYLFRNKVIAARFAKVFTAPVFPYLFYKEFWLNDTGQRKMDERFAELGFAPEVVIPNRLDLKKSRTLTGARSCFIKNTGWFFEKERDALVFLMDNA